MYMVILESDGNVVYQKIKDKDTLWIVVEAMLDGDVEMTVSITRIKDTWYGKGEEKHEYTMGDQ